MNVKSSLDVIFPLSLARRTSLFDQIVAILFLRFYRLSQDPKERWTHLASIVIFSLCSLWFFYHMEFYAADVISLCSNPLDDIHIE